MCVEVAPCASCSSTTSQSVLVGSISGESDISTPLSLSKVPILVPLFLFHLFPLTCCSVGKRQQTGESQAADTRPTRSKVVISWVPAPHQGKRKQRDSGSSDALPTVRLLSIHHQATFISPHL